MLILLALLIRVHAWEWLYVICISRYNNAWICLQESKSQLSQFLSGRARRYGVGDPVDDIEEEERQRKTLARDLVDAPRSSLATLGVYGYRKQLPRTLAPTVERLLLKVPQTI